MKRVSVLIKESLNKQPISRHVNFFHILPRTGFVIYGTAPEPSFSFEGNEDA